METTVKEITEGLLISVNGRIDTTNYIEFEKVVDKLLSKKVSQIFLDCSKLNYISSSGLRVFLTILRKMTKSGGHFKLIAMQPNIKEIFDISGFSSIFSIFPDLEAAIQQE
ncbi:MAG: STAS domain-containing protein [Mariniphaga sp.]|jgi:anti-anti-sigma factor|nr:STAS domain-containing protein [Mariniphaga sp.]MDD4224974.1 STAS domain-containing protein [Mariniphaga sp.]MDD4424621.1 STAS domain-containing protein [Mariniphaga sp.]